jgi:hypothetical protein
MEMNFWYCLVAKPMGQCTSNLARGESFWALSAVFEFPTTKVFEPILQFKYCTLEFINFLIQNSSVLISKRAFVPYVQYAAEVGRTIA